MLIVCIFPSLDARQWTVDFVYCLLAPGGIKNAVKFSGRGVWLYVQPKGDLVCMQKIDLVCRLLASRGVKNAVKVQNIQGPAADAT